VLGKGQWTPAPWINVIANAEFGFTVSELGSGYTWSLNSRLNQLTPWSNDPVSDAPGEIFYLHDDETGDLWSPTALPIRVDNAVMWFATARATVVSSILSRYSQRAAAICKLGRPGQNFSFNLEKHFRSPP